MKNQATKDGMTYSQHNYLNQIGIPFDAALKSNQNKGCAYIKTQVFMAKDLVEPQPMPKPAPSEVPPFCAYSKTSYNVKATNENELENDTLLQKYNALCGNRPKTANPQQLKQIEGIVRRHKIGHNDDFTITNNQKKVTLSPIDQIKATKRKQRLISEQRSKPKPSKPRSPVNGTILSQSSFQPLPELNKADFKIWKPWLPEQNLPKWAEQMQNDKLGNLVAPQVQGSIELPQQFYNAFKCNDKILMYVDKYKKEPILDHIYRKFQQQLAQYTVDQSFKIKGVEEMRNDAEEKYERQARKEELERCVLLQMEMYDQRVRDGVSKDFKDQSIQGDLQDDLKDDQTGAMKSFDSKRLSDDTDSVMEGDISEDFAEQSIQDGDQAMPNVDSECDELSVSSGEDILTTMATSMHSKFAQQFERIIKKQAKTTELPEPIEQQLNQTVSHQENDKTVQGTQEGKAVDLSKTHVSSKNDDLKTVYKPSFKTRKQAQVQQQIDNILDGRKATKGNSFSGIKTTIPKTQQTINLQRVDSWMANIERQNHMMELVSNQLVSQVMEADRQFKAIEAKATFVKGYNQTKAIKANKQLASKGSKLPLTMGPAKEESEMSSSGKSVGQNYRETCEMVKKFQL